MRKPVIGLIPLYDEGKESYWMLPGYMTGLEEAGAIPLMLSPTTDEKTLEQMAEMLDGFLLTGGHDVDPALYGETAKKECGAPCRQRDQMEKILLNKVLKLDKPVFGICRGLQFLNVYLGGSLYQDIPTEHPSEIEHHMKPPYYLPIHSVKVKEKGLLQTITGRSSLEVNSYHHQAVRDTAPSLEELAWAPDGLVEAVCMPEKRFVLAVQWHPELSYKRNEDSKRLFDAFVKSCIEAEA